MTHGLIAARSILGKEIGQRLFQLDSRVKIRAFSNVASEEGDLAEFGRGASLIESLDFGNPGDALSELQTLFVPIELTSTHLQELRNALPKTARLIVVDGSGWSKSLADDPAITTPVLSALPHQLVEASEEPMIYVSPEPALICQALLLRALSPLQPERVSTTVLVPASALSSEAVEELLEQARSILAFSGEMPTQHHGGQQAFNSLIAGSRDNTKLLESLSGVALANASQQSVRTGTFHGIALSMHCSFETPLPSSALRAAVEKQPALEAGGAADEGTPHPVGTAGAPTVTVSFSAESEQPSTEHWFWIVTDNLTTTGAWNAVDVALSGRVESAVSEVN